MAILTEKQIREGYFDIIGGFPPLNASDDNTNYAREVKDYKGQERLCIVCTQLDNYGYNNREKKRVLMEWLDYLQTNTKAFKALHFNSRVPQVLFDAACCQEDLVELRFKWGAYADLSALENLQNLRYLYIGSGAGVQDIAALGKLKSLIVLYVENFKRIEDYSPITTLDKLEQLIISGPTLGRTPIKDLDFLLEMKSLLSFWKPNTTIKRKYTPDERAALRAALQTITFINDCL
ncbi:MAG: hypothetical protein FWH52_06310 [Synergistaceae bacterium]|nr:hypothetical protein [Synergistaceae bacterium]